MSKAKDEKIIRDTIEELFTLLTIDATFDLSLNEEGVDVVVNTKDSGIVIGYHGEVLEALQLVSSLCITKRLGRFVRVSLEVGDYKKNRTEWLTSLASQIKEQVVTEQKEMALPNLKSWERRIVHMLLAEDKDVVSESVGMGKERTLVIKPRQ